MIAPHPAGGLTAPPSAYGPTSIWGVKPSFARMVVTQMCFLLHEKRRICPHWGVNCHLTPRPVRLPPQTPSWKRLGYTPIRPPTFVSGSTPLAVVKLSLVKRGLMC